MKICQRSDFETVGGEETYDDYVSIGKELGLLCIDINNEDFMVRNQISSLRKQEMAIVFTRTPGLSEEDRMWVNSIVFALKVIER